MSNVNESIIHEFVDRKASTKVISDLHQKLMDRSHHKHQILKNASTIMVQDEGYISKLGVSLDDN